MKIKRFDDMKNSKEEFMIKAIEAAIENVNRGGGPFGAVVVKNDEIISIGTNAVTMNNDPTAHAEVMAIRKACKKLGTFQLDGCEIYTTCYPCLMCYGSIYWARPAIVYYGCDQHDAAKAGFDDDFIYRELNKSPDSRQIKLSPLLRDKALQIFDLWNGKIDKIEY